MVLFRRNPQPFCDGAGGNSLFWGGPTVSELPLWGLSWEDDLIMTGVRSFDIKAYDNSLAGYADLGWGDDLRYYPLSPIQNSHPTSPPFISGTPNLNLVGNPGFTPTPGVPGFTPYLFWNNQVVDLINQTLPTKGGYLRWSKTTDTTPSSVRFSPASTKARPITQRTTLTTTVTWATTRPA